MVEDLPEHNVCAIVVTYNPDVAALGSLLSAISQQVGSIVIVDNASPEPVVSWLRGQASTADMPGGIRFIALEDNLGLGAAYNIGISMARNLGAAFVLLMDQDSIPKPGMVGKLKSARTVLVKRRKCVGVVGPRICYSEITDPSNVMPVSRFRFRSIDSEDSNGVVRVASLISSGSLISIEALNQVGGMDEQLFIDHVDTEWCLRAQSKGFGVYGVSDAIMRHSLGERHSHIWCGRWRTVPFHQPFRYYYIFRNSVLLWRRPYIPNRWKRTNQLTLFKLLVYHGMIAPNRLANARMMWRGWRDGWRGVGGAMSESLQ